MASMRTKKRRHYQRMGYRIANPPMVSDREAIPSPLYAVLRSHLPHALALWAEALMAAALRSKP